MDTTNYRSLIDKIAGKGIITPYEAIYLQHINHQYTKEQEPDISQQPNPYIAVDQISGILPSYQLQKILTFSTKEEGNEYDGYKWAAQSLSHFDTNCADMGYKGLALLSELRYIRTENVMKFITHETELKDGETFFDFTSYSIIEQKYVKYSEVFESFVLNFRYLLITIDNILTMNYFLDTMFSPQELKSIQFLKQWLIKEKQAEEDEEPFNLPNLCMDLAADIIISTNHKDFTEYMIRHLGSLWLRLPANFQEKSLLYVQKTIEEQTGQKLKSSESVTPSALAIT